VGRFDAIDQRSAVGSTVSVASGMGIIRTILPYLGPCATSPAGAAAGRNYARGEGDFHDREDFNTPWSSKPFAIMETLRQAGFTVLNDANNHILGSGVTKAP
jgi:hypothetical protein